MIFCQKDIEMKLINTGSNFAEHYSNNAI